MGFGFRVQGSGQWSEKFFQGSSCSSLLLGTLWICLVLGGVITYTYHLVLSSKVPRKCVLVICWLFCGVQLRPEQVVGSTMVYTLYQGYQMPKSRQRHSEGRSPKIDFYLGQSPIA